MWSLAYGVRMPFHQVSRREFITLLGGAAGGTATPDYPDHCSRSMIQMRKLYTNGLAA
jgi:hypothetical protein